MKTRMEGLVQLKTGDAVKGAISREQLIFWKFLRVDNATALSASDPDHPSVIDGVVWIPRANISFLQELTKVDV